MEDAIGCQLPSPLSPYRRRLCSSVFTNWFSIVNDYNLPILFRFQGIKQSISPLSKDSFIKHHQICHFEAIFRYRLVAIAHQSSIIQMEYIYRRNNVWFIGSTYMTTTWSFHTNRNGNEFINVSKFRVRVSKMIYWTLHGAIFFIPWNIMVYYNIGIL